MPNELVWSSLAVARLDAAVQGGAPVEAAQLVDTLQELHLSTGWGRPGSDEELVLHCTGFRVTYQIAGVGTRLRILDVQEIR